MNNERFYLGISLGFNSSACVYSNERGLVAAVSQERLNGEKNTKELPFDAILAVLKIANTNVIDAIGISHYEEMTEGYFHKYGKRFNLKGDNWVEFIYNFLKENEIEVRFRAIMTCSHHHAHALSTYGFYGVPEDSSNHYLITSDGFGDGESATIIYDGNKISSIELKNSIALVYQFVTGALGFKEHQHEGKITGLAAFGEPIYMKDFENLYYIAEDAGNGLCFKSFEYDLTDDEHEQVKNSAIVDFNHFLKLKKAVYGLVNDLIEKGAKREDIAATVQEFAEKYTLLWIENYCQPGHDAYIAGGLFANVKINQRLKDLKDGFGNKFFTNVYVCPGMGDEGTAVGVAIYVAGQFSDVKFGKSEHPSKHVISGTNFDESDVEKYGLDDTKYKVTKLEDSIDFISHKLAENKIVCLMREQMEFGPRALCHRSILYNADSRETNDWLNKKLSRTEFMPFAPVTREEVADDLFINLDGGRDSAKFMTMTFDCTDEFAENYKAACHIDKTARPQIVSKTDDEYMWTILEKYQELTGKKAMINTSFNLHNNPIIESVKVAIDSWIKSDTDVLVVGNYAIEVIR